MVGARGPCVEASGVPLVGTVLTRLRTAKTGCARLVPPVLPGVRTWLPQLTHTKRPRAMEGAGSETRVLRSDLDSAGVGPPWVWARPFLG